MHIVHFHVKCTKMTVFDVPLACLRRRNPPSLCILLLLISNSRLFQDVDRCCHSEHQKTSKVDPAMTFDNDFDCFFHFEQKKCTGGGKGPSRNLQGGGSRVRPPLEIYNKKAVDTVSAPPVHFLRGGD